MDLEKFMQEQIDCLKKEEEKYGQLEEYEKGEMFAYEKIKKALNMPDVVGRSEQLKAFIEWQKWDYKKPYDTPTDEIIKDYESL